jgi:hypothetical protein
MSNSPRRFSWLAVFGGLGLVLLVGAVRLFGQAAVDNLASFRLGDRTGGDVHSYQAPTHDTLAPHRYTPLRFTAAPGWEEIADLGDGKFPPVALLRIERGGNVAEVTVTSLAGEAGGMLANVNRWRSLQLKLDPYKTEEEMTKALKDIKIAGKPAHYVNIPGPEGPKQERILGAILKRGTETWFFKMRGPAGLVQDNERAFKDEFLESVRFEKGEADDAGGRS